jgi:hypothetical protein
MGAGVIHTLKVRGQDFEVYLDDRGRFFANVGSDQVRDETMEGLRKLLMRETKKLSTKIAVPITVITRGATDRWSQYGHELEGDTYTDYVMVGVHARSESPLIVDEKGKKSQLDYWMKSLVYRQLDDADKIEHQGLVERYVEAKEALEAFLAERKIEDPRKVVMAEMERVLAEKGESLDG